MQAFLVFYLKPLKHLFFKQCKNMASLSARFLTFFSTLHFALSQKKMHASEPLQGFDFQAMQKCGKPSGQIFDNNILHNQNGWFSFGFYFFFQKMSIHL